MQCSPETAAQSNLAWVSPLSVEYLVDTSTRTAFQFPAFQRGRRLSSAALPRQARRADHSPSQVREGLESVRQENPSGPTGRQYHELPTRWACNRPVCELTLAAGQGWVNLWPLGPQDTAPKSTRRLQSLYRQS